MHHHGLLIYRLYVDIYKDYLISCLNILNITSVHGWLANLQIKILPDEHYFRLEPGGGGRKNVFSGPELLPSRPLL